MPLSRALNASVTVGEVELSVAATLGFGVVRFGVGGVVAGRCTSVFFCEPADDLFVLVVVVVVRGRTVGEVSVFCAKALAAENAKTKTIAINISFFISHSS